MKWEEVYIDYKNYLKLEKNLSENSIKSYLYDLKYFITFSVDNEQLNPYSVSFKFIQKYIQEVAKNNLSARTQARYISALKSFFYYLQLDERRDDNPTELIESPKIGMKLPDTLSEKEINSIINSINLSLEFGHRNKAILELLYGCGLRVSEVINLKFSDLFFSENYIRVIGKGNKQRLVPIANATIKNVNQYLNHYRKQQETKKGFNDFLFISKRGKSLTRVMVFIIIKNLKLQNNISKKISPHTFRHSFASHLIQNGADIRSIQMMLGHESITTTEIYTHLEQKHLQKTILKHHPRNKKND